MRVAGLVTYEMLIDLLLLTCRVLEMGKNGGGGGPWLGLWEFFVQQAGDTRTLSVFPVEGLGDESLVPQVVPERTVRVPRTDFLCCFVFIELRNWRLQGFGAP